MSASEACVQHWRLRLRRLASARDEAEALNSVRVGVILQFIRCAVQKHLRENAWFMQRIV